MHAKVDTFCEKFVVYYCSEKGCFSFPDASSFELNIILFYEDGALKKMKGGCDMKFFTTDKNEWTKLKSEFDKSLVAKNILGVNKTIYVSEMIIIFSYVLTYGLDFIFSTEDNLFLEHNFFILTLLNFLGYIITRYCYYAFMLKFSKEKE